MSKVIAAFNMTLDGVCDHTTGIADEELHQHYAELINSGEIILYGRTTYQLMQFWQEVLKHPSEEKSMNDFAISIGRIPKLVFSNTIKNTGWDSARLADKTLVETVPELKQNSKKDILIGSRSLIIQLLNSNQIDEFQICIHPVIEGKGLKLFDQIKDRIVLKHIRTKPLKSGAIVQYYEPAREQTDRMLIQKYTSTWIDDFRAITHELETTFGGFNYRIEHVGSTSVPNLDAKPIIDIDIVYYNPGDFIRIKASLEEIGYNHNGNQGIEERDVFKRNGTIINDVLDSIKHHLYVCPVGSNALERHILSRNFLRKNDWARVKYQQMKYELAERANQGQKLYAALKELHVNDFIDSIIAEEKSNEQQI